MPDPVQFDLSKDPGFIQMQKMIQGLGVLIQQQGNVINDLRQKAATPAPARGPNGEENDDDEVDADKLSNKELMGLILKNVGSLLDEKIGGVTKQIQGVATSVNSRELGQQYEQLKGQYKDFEEWSDEMKQLSKENPTLSLKRLYLLARQENADKAKTLDEKYADKKDETDDSVLTLFGGFRPTTKTSGEGGEGSQKTKMTIDQALDKAWTDAVAKVPALGKMEDALD